MLDPEGWRLWSGEGHDPAEECSKSQVLFKVINLMSRFVCSLFSAWLASYTC